MSGDSVRVGVRMRPLNSRERSEAPEAGAANGSAPGAAARAGMAWEVDGAGGSIRRLQNDQRYSFDFMFEPTATNADVYAELAEPVVDAALGGYNGTIFAFRPTATGKTWSTIGDKRDPGITPLAVGKVMRAKSEAAAGRKYTVAVTYCEIYNEVIRDLLDEKAGEVLVRETVRGVTFVDSNRVEVETVEEAMAVLEKGQALRGFGETKFNRTSSRSHCIFTIVIRSKGRAVGSEKMQRERYLHLVDLAGSERSKKTGAHGAVQREANSINKSLLTLGRIIMELSSEAGSRGKHLPYRDSKLTRVLRDALGGNSRTAVLCACSPSFSQAEETRNTLAFAERAKHVMNEAVKNEVVDYKAKFLESSAELEILRATGGSAVGSSSVGGNSVGVCAGADALEMKVDLDRALQEVASLRDRAASAELAAGHATHELRGQRQETRELRAEKTIAKNQIKRLKRNDRDLAKLKAEVAESQERRTFYIPHRLSVELIPMLGEKVICAVQTYLEIARRFASERGERLSGPWSDYSSFAVFPVEVENASSFILKLQSTAYYMIFVEERKAAIDWRVADASLLERPTVAKVKSKTAKANALVGAAISEVLFEGCLFPSAGRTVDVLSYAELLKKALQSISMCNKAEESRILQEVLEDGQSAFREGDYRSYQYVCHIVAKYVPVTLLCRPNKVEVQAVCREDAFVIVLSLLKVTSLLEKKSPNPKAYDLDFFWQPFCEARAAFGDFVEPRVDIDPAPLCESVCFKALQPFFKAIDEVVKLSKE